MNIVQHFDRFVILDFETTCLDKKSLEFREIIEFPVIIVNAKNFKILDKFHSYVKPIYNKKLSSNSFQFKGKIYYLIKIFKMVNFNCITKVYFLKKLLK